MQQDPKNIVGQDNIDILSERLLGPGRNDDDDLERPLFIDAMAEVAEPGEFVVEPGMGHHNPMGHDNMVGHQRRTVASGGGVPEAQQPEYRDAPFAIAFILQVLVVTGLAFGWGLGSLKQDDGANGNGGGTSKDGGSTSLTGVLWLGFLTCLVSIVMSGASLQLMKHHAEYLIQSSLIASCGLLGFVAVALFLNDAVTMGVFWSVMVAFTVLYTRAVWYRIPFAAANLRTALSAIQTNAGVCVVAYGLSLVANLYLLVWILAFIGVSYKESTCQNGVCRPHMNAISILLLVVSYHWTSQVVKNVLHVTVSGVVGTWWFAPQEALSVFSPAIQDSLRRATTYSFGSVCMGSLLVAIIQTLQTLVRSARRNTQGGLLLCILDCILRFLSRTAQYFNKWAMVYVGLYGYDYLTAGKKVMELFQQRGWSAIINDNLVHRTLALVSVVIGALSGFFGMMLAHATGWATAALGGAAGESSGSSGSGGGAGLVFMVCFVIGLSMAYILMSVIMSAVDTVIVSFAEAPAEFETNHPALSQNMMIRWREVYPNECGY